MSKISITIDNVKLDVEDGITALEAAKLAHIKIPTLCFLKDINEVANCRVCVVEVQNKLVASCTLRVHDGMEIKTNTKDVRDARKTVVELLLSNHKRECTTCIRDGNCELQRLAKEFNIRQLEYEGEKSKSTVDSSSPSIIRDNEKCILCGRCISVCKNVQKIQAINFTDRGFNTKVTAPYDTPLGETNCINCGQCIIACPVGALYENESIEQVWNAIHDKEKFVVVQTAPAVRVALGEEFGIFEPKSVTGKMVSALRRIGFDKVFDTNFAADLTIIEEGNEFLKRLEAGENLPIMTSCCPGWVKFVEHNYPEMINNLSTCKSPNEMEGSLIKSYFAQKMGIDPSKIITVSIMPCVGKKYEKKSVDYVLTTRELAKMIKEAAIDFENIEDDTFDDPFGESTGAAVIFGATGGVAEAALRTVAEIIAGKDLETKEYTQVRGIKGIKEVTIELPDKRVLSLAVVSGLANARQVLQWTKNGEKHYDFIEVMACPGGCINGGGQPMPSMEKSELIKKRLTAIYEEDRNMPFRKSHKNPYIKKIYDEFLKEPNSQLCHELLHTSYTDRGKYF